MAYAKSTEGGLYGVMAEFDDSDLLLEAGVGTHWVCNLKGLILKHYLNIYSHG